jgi:sugar/nucleoside kinase (ribokinase family)
LSSQQARVVVAGHICLDMIPAFEVETTTLAHLLTPGNLIKTGPLTTATGGSVSNTGLALHRLGVPCKLMGKVGDDLVGRAIVDIVRAVGPELAEGMIVEKGHPSSYTVVINPPGVDRIFLHCPGANDTFGADDVDYGQLSGPRLFHFGYPPLMRRMFIDGGVELSTLLSRAKERGITTSLDMARPDPASEAGKADWPQILARALPHVDVFLPSFDETLFMLDRPRFDRMVGDSESSDFNASADAAALRQLADQLLAMGAVIVALKLGTQGLYLRTSPDPAKIAAIGPCAPADPAAWADRELLAPCFEVTVAGTTGSGDCTIAGFLTGLLEGLSPEHVMTSAVAVGACNVEQADATSGIPTWPAVQQRIRSDWTRRPVAVSLPGWRWDETHRVWCGPDDHS